MLFRGVARNLLQGTKERVWGTEVPQRGPKAEPPVGVWGRSPQKPETNVNFQLRRAACTHGYATDDLPFVQPTLLNF